MKSPKDMKIIQIEITNTCPNRCANCTRFCGHQKRPFFMDLATFQKAVDSMIGFPGIVGIMGGEPTLHPEFETFVRYYKDHFGYDEKPKYIYKGPVADFINYICRNKMDININNQRGLWSSLGHKYYKNFELIQDTFGYQCLNDHTHSSLHETLMVTRKELGIPDDEWFVLRDSCWIQNLWSASITPKGAFFCEVAAALDMLFDGPGGWPIEPGWWKRKPSEFGDQLQWCELCSAPLPMPKRDANLEIDDASPEWCKMLDKINSPKYIHGKVECFDLSSYDKEMHSVINDSIPYLKDQSKRLENRNGGLEPKKLSIILDVRDYDKKTYLELVRHNLKYSSIDGIIIYSENVSDELLELKVPLISLSDKNQEYSLSDVINPINFNDFVLVMRNYHLRGDPREVCSQLVFNPGNFYFFQNENDEINCMIFNTRASSLHQNPRFNMIGEVFPKHKKVILPIFPDLTPDNYMTPFIPLSGFRKIILQIFYNQGLLNRFFNRIKISCNMLK